MPETAEAEVEMAVDETPMVTMKCPRCGEEHEVEEGTDPFTKEDGCDECEDWVQCYHCHKWVESTTEVHGHGDWCEDCVDADSFTCEYCGDLHHDDDGAEVYTGRRSTQTWCNHCRGNNSTKCSDCGEIFDDHHWEGSEVDGEQVCRECLDNGDYHYCDSCDEWRNGECTSCSGHRFRARRSYGNHDGFKKVALRSKIMIGMEMEVGEIERLGNLSDGWDEFGTEFAYPTEDGSLADSGVEFIGHPWDAWKHLSEFEQYEKFFGLLEDAGATLRTSPSGCHINVHFDAFGSKDAMRAAVVAANRFRSALWCFTPERTLSSRQHYAQGVSFKDGVDPLTLISRTGKYSIANWKEGEDILEFRIPAMVLEPERFMAQIQLYHNLVAWSAGKTAAEASIATFDEIFLPILFGSTIQDVVEAGRLVKPECIGNPI